MSHKQNTVKTVFGFLKMQLKLRPGKTSSKDAYGYFVRENHYTDWGYQEPKDVSEAREQMIKGKNSLASKGKDLKSGMLLTVFNTISKGEMAWSGTINLERSKNSEHDLKKVFCRDVHYLQKGVEPRKWASMFLEKMPATLEHDGKVIHGSLDTFIDLYGEGGAIWVLKEFGKSGYDGMHGLENGDTLTVYSKVTEGGIAWQSKLRFKDFPKGPKEVEMSSDYGSRTVGRLPKGIKKKKWQTMFWNHAPIKIEMPRSLKK